MNASKLFFIKLLNLSESIELGLFVKISIQVLKKMRQHSLSEGGQHVAYFFHLLLVRRQHYEFFISQFPCLTKKHSEIKTEKINEIVIWFASNQRRKENDCVVIVTV